MNGNLLALIGLVLMLSIGPMIGRFYRLDYPRLPNDNDFILAGIVWTIGMMCFVLGVTSIPVPN